MDKKMLIEFATGLLLEQYTICALQPNGTNVS